MTTNETLTFREDISQLFGNRRHSSSRESSVLFTAKRYLHTATTAVEHHQPQTGLGKPGEAVAQTKMADLKLLLRETRHPFPQDALVVLKNQPKHEGEGGAS